VDKNDLNFVKVANSALHPGESAAIYDKDKQIGIVGALHPNLLQQFDANGKIYVFDLYLDQLATKGFPLYSDVGKFPEIRRDLAIIVNETIPSKDIQDRIKSVAGDWLKDVFIFDVYKGKGISPGLKSIALALVLQHPTRTLVDNEVTSLMERVVSELRS